MAAYILTNWSSSTGPLATVLLELETYLETIDDTKIIHGMGVLRIGSDNGQAWVVHDT